uniref:Uncharacterized protein n=1 Tax=Opuntia streptacantha TaxID=393608 RepID=A0A7C9AU93_OPUST
MPPPVVACATLLNISFNISFHASRLKRIFTTVPIKFSLKCLAQYEWLSSPKHRAVEGSHRKLVLADHTVTLLASQFENWCLLVTGDLSQQIQEKLLLDASWSHDRVV